MSEAAHLISYNSTVVIFIAATSLGHRITHRYGMFSESIPLTKYTFAIKGSCVNFASA